MAIVAVIELAFLAWGYLAMRKQDRAAELAV
jgi:hypothetical protein